MRIVSRLLPAEIPSLGKRRELRSHCDLCSGKRPRRAVTMFGLVRVCEYCAWYRFFTETLPSLETTLREVVAETGLRNYSALAHRPELEPFVGLVARFGVAEWVIEQMLARFAAEETARRSR